MKENKYIIYYLIFINIFGFIICLIDKNKAKKKRYRISENFLLFISFIGGCIGFYLGMYLFHHKTKKAKFYIGIPLIIIIDCIIYFHVI